MIRPGKKAPQGKRYSNPGLPLLRGSRNHWVTEAVSNKQTNKETNITVDSCADAERNDSFIHQISVSVQGAEGHWEIYVDHF